MSAAHPSPTAPGTFLCPRCGNTLHEDQSWCLECGLAARTRIHPPPSWRVPVLLTCIALALLAGGIAVALVTLLDTPESTPPAATVTVPAATTPVAPAPTTVPQATAPTTPAPTTSVPTTAAPGATAPASTTPPATTPSSTQSGGASARPQRTFTIPGTGIRLPANAGD